MGGRLGGGIFSGCGFSGSGLGIGARVRGRCMAFVSTSTASITGPAALTGRSARVQVTPMAISSTHSACTAMDQARALIWSLKESKGLPRRAPLGLVVRRPAHQPDLGRASLLQHHHHVVHAAIVDARVAADQDRSLGILAHEC